MRVEREALRLHVKHASNEDRSRLSKAIVVRHGLRNAIVDVISP